MHFIDTNVLLRFLTPADSFYSQIRQALIALRTKGEQLCTTSQNIAEFWSVYTRPSDLVLKPAQIKRVYRHRQQVEETFRLLKQEFDWGERAQSEGADGAPAFGIDGAMIDPTSGTDSRADRLCFQT
jgi:predicted nucleic acid-binding protein